ncbi:MAG: SDR family NAD(P)-dependent oxidoreductase, partial [Lysobacteraceae bacterium]
MKYSFKGDTALVTGAGSGIGAATAKLLAENDVRVVVSDIDADTVARVVAEIIAAGGDAVAHVGDVSRPEDAQSAVVLAQESFGALHLAFNNAGIGGTLKPAGELEPAEWQRVIDINLSGVQYGLRYQIPAMLAAGGGAIVNMSS